MTKKTVFSWNWRYSSHDHQYKFCWEWSFLQEHHPVWQKIEHSCATWQFSSFCHKPNGWSKHKTWLLQKGKGVLLKAVLLVDQILFTFYHLPFPFLYCYCLRLRVVYGRVILSTLLQSPFFYLVLRLYYKKLLSMLQFSWANLIGDPIVRVVIPFSLLRVFLLIDDGFSYFSYNIHCALRMRSCNIFAPRKDLQMKYKYQSTISLIYTQLPINKIWRNQARVFTKKSGVGCTQTWTVWIYKMLLLLLFIMSDKSNITLSMTRGKKRTKISLITYSNNCNSLERSPVIASSSSSIKAQFMSFCFPRMHMYDRR